MKNDDNPLLAIYVSGYCLQQNQVVKSPALRYRTNELSPPVQRLKCGDEIRSECSTIVMERGGKARYEFHIKLPPGTPPKHGKFIEPDFNLEQRGKRRDTMIDHGQHWGYKPSDIREESQCKGRKDDETNRE